MAGFPSIRIRKSQRLAVFPDLDECFPCGTNGMVKRLCSFNVVDLIAAVEKRPCLWDRRRDDYKDRGVKERAWREVGNILYQNYEEIGEEEQKKLEAGLLDRWRNIRDAFIKSLKKKPTDENAIKRKYMYHDYLLFLLHNYEKEETSSTCDESMEAPESYPDEDEVEIDDKKQIATVEMEENKVTPITRKRKAAAENEVENSASGSGLQMVDEDEAFLWSLLPTMKKLSRDDSFQFRIEIMQLLQKYKMQTKMRQLQSSLNSSTNS